MSTNLHRPVSVGTAVKRVMGTTAAVPLLFAAMPMAAQAAQTSDMDMQEMQQQIQELQLRVSKMQKQQQQENTDGQEEDSGFTVGNTTFGLGGYIKLDAVYNFDQNAVPSAGPTVAAGQNPGDGNRFGATARQSRLTITSNTPTSMGDVDGTIQFDFYDDPDSYENSFSHNYNPRVRLAYFTWNNWTIGKAWTTFSDFNYGTTLDFWGPQAQIFRRHAQVRYTFDLANDDNIDVALESPSDQSLDGADNAVKAPDFVVRYQGSAGNLSYQAAALARYLRGDVPDPRPGQPNRSRHDSEFGYGLEMGGSYAMATGTTIMLTGNYGEGDGAYVYNPAGGADAYADDDNSLDAIERYGYTATISQELSPKWTGNVVWGQGFSEGYAGNPDGQHNKSSTLFVNVLYNVVDPLTIGAEYGHLSYSDDRPYGNSDRLQLSAIYHF